MTKDEFTILLKTKCIEQHGEGFENILSKGYTDTAHYWMVLYESVDIDVDEEIIERLIDDIYYRSDLYTNMDPSYVDFSLKKTGEMALNKLLDITLDNDKLVMRYIKMDIKYLKGVLNTLYNNKYEYSYITKELRLIGNNLLYIY